MHLNKPFYRKKKIITFRYGVLSLLAPRKIPGAPEKLKNDCGINIHLVHQFAECILKCFQQSNQLLQLALI